MSHAWLSLLLATADASATEEEVLTVLVGARTWEVLAEQLDPAEAELALTAGMISAFDTMLDLDLEEILAQLTSDGPLGDAVRQGPRRSATSWPTSSPASSAGASGGPG